jgi:hypothetical protein
MLAFDGVAVQRASQGFLVISLYRPHLPPKLWRESLQYSTPLSNILEKHLGLCCEPQVLCGDALAPSSCATWRGDHAWAPECVLCVCVCVCVCCVFVCLCDGLQEEGLVLSRHAFVGHRHHHQAGESGVCVRVCVCVTLPEPQHQAFPLE